MKILMNLNFIFLRTCSPVNLLTVNDIFSDSISSSFRGMSSQAFKKQNLYVQINGKDGNRVRLSIL